MLDDFREVGLDVGGVESSSSSSVVVSRISPERRERESDEGEGERDPEREDVGDWVRESGSSPDSRSRNEGSL